MRSSHAKMVVWPFAENHNKAEPERTEETPEAFDSFGPVSDLRRALTKPAAPRPTFQAPHDFTRILLADHDAFDRRVLRILLSSPRVSMIEVEDGQSAVDLLALRSFDLLVLDLDLPQMTGEDTISWVRRSRAPWADIPILGLVSEAHLPDAGRLVSLGMTDWTAKPINRQNLVEKLIRVMPGLYDAKL